MNGFTFSGVMKNVAEKMLLEFEQSRNIQHNPIKGRERESIITESFLKKYLPLRYAIGSGIIVDSNTKESKQQDLVIYDQFYSPIFLDFDENKYFFSETVFIVIEVKSCLDLKELEDTVNKSASVWNLSKAALPEIVLQPNLILPNVQIPTLCMAFCFESTMALKDIPDRTRELTTKIINGNALSAICILKDKNGESGVIINTEQDNLLKPQIIPSTTSRIGVLKCSDAGDALLYTYFLIMEHLRTLGTISSGPNLMQYIDNVESGKVEIKISTKEMQGTHINLEGKNYDVDVLSKIRNLSLKIIRDRNATDEEILEYFYYYPQILGGENVLDPRSKIYVDGIPTDFPSFVTIYEAITRNQSGTANDGDIDLLSQFVKLIKSIGNRYKDLRIGFYREEK